LSWVTAPLRETNRRATMFSVWLSWEWTDAVTTPSSGKSITRSLRKSKIFHVKVHYCYLSSIDSSLRQTASHCSAMLRRRCAGAVSHPPPLLQSTPLAWQARCTRQGTPYSAISDPSPRFYGGARRMIQTVRDRHVRLPASVCLTSWHGSHPGAAQEGRKQKPLHNLESMKEQYSCFAVSRRSNCIDYNTIDEMPYPSMPNCPLALIYDGHLFLDTMDQVSPQPSQRRERKKMRPEMVSLLMMT
jgi:hypothetical protein